MDDGWGSIIGMVIIIAVALFVLYIITLIAASIAMIAAAGGSLWGGGWAILNYGKSIKENLIDSNRTPMAT